MVYVILFFHSVRIIPGVLQAFATFLLSCGYNLKSWNCAFVISGVAYCVLQWESEVKDFSIQSITGVHQMCI